MYKANNSNSDLSLFTWWSVYQAQYSFCKFCFSPLYSVTSRSLCSRVPGSSPSTLAERHTKVARETVIGKETARLKHFLRIQGLRAIHFPHNLLSYDPLQFTVYFFLLRARQRHASFIRQLFSFNMFQIVLARTQSRTNPPVASWSIQRNKNKK